MPTKLVIQILMKVFKMHNLEGSPALLCDMVHAWSSFQELHRLSISKISTTGDPGQNLAVAPNRF